MTEALPWDAGTRNSREFRDTLSARKSPRGRA